MSPTRSALPGFLTASLFALTLGVFAIGTAGCTDPPDPGTPDASATGDASRGEGGSSDALGDRVASDGAAPTTDGGAADKTALTDGAADDASPADAGADDALASDVALAD